MEEQKRQICNQGLSLHHQEPFHIRFALCWARNFHTGPIFSTYQAGSPLPKNGKHQFAYTPPVAAFW